MYIKNITTLFALLVKTERKLDNWRTGKGRTNKKIKLLQQQQQKQLF